MGFPPTTGGAGGILQQASVSLTSGDITGSSATFIDLTGVTVTLSTGAHRCLVGFTALCQHSVGASISFDIAIDGVRQGGTGGLTQGVCDGAGTNANPSFTFLTGVLSAASHTIKIQWIPVGATGKVFASAVAPCGFYVIETSLST